VRGTPDSVLYTIRRLASRARCEQHAPWHKPLHHINLGVACTTGTSGQNYSYATVGGGNGSSASGARPWSAAAAGTSPLAALRLSAAAVITPLRPLRQRSLAAATTPRRVTELRSQAAASTPPRLSSCGWRRFLQRGLGYFRSSERWQVQRRLGRYAAVVGGLADTASGSYAVVAAAT